MARISEWRHGRAAWAARRVRRTAVVMAGALVVGLLPAGMAAAASSAKQHMAASAAPHDKLIPFTRATPKRGPSPKPFSLAVSLGFGGWRGGNAKVPS